MQIIYGFLIFVNIVVSILLVVSILMQRAKGGGLAGIAGGAASQAVFGGRGAATMIHKATIILAIIFGVNCLVMGVLSKGIGQQVSVTQEALESEDLNKYWGDQAPAEETVPVTTAPATGEEAPAGGE